MSAASILLLGALVLVLGFVADASAMKVMLPGAFARLAPAMLANVAAGAVAWMERAITTSGAIAFSTTWTNVAGKSARTSSSCARSPRRCA